MYALARLEETGLSTWLRESGAAFFTVLTLHSLAMALVVGISLAMALRLLGVTPAFPMQRWQSFRTLLWLGVALILLSGFGLLLAYPAKALTNPVFYLKLLALLGALWLTWIWLQNDDGGLSRFWRPGPRSSGWLLIACWMLTVGGGRFLAYTNSILLASRYY